MSDRPPSAASAESRAFAWHCRDSLHLGFQIGPFTECRLLTFSLTDPLFVLRKTSRIFFSLCFTKSEPLSIRSLTFSLHGHGLRHFDRCRKSLQNRRGAWPGFIQRIEIEVNTAIACCLRLLRRSSLAILGFPVLAPRLMARSARSRRLGHRGGRAQRPSTRSDAARAMARSRAGGRSDSGSSRALPPDKPGVRGRPRRWGMPGVICFNTPYQFISIGGYSRNTLATVTRIW